MTMSNIGVEFQLQIYILAAVFLFMFIFIVLFLAAICGQISKIKRQQRRMQFDRTKQITDYDNYAYKSRTIQPEEELGRRGYTMYDSYRNNSDTANVHPANGKFAKSQAAAQGSSLSGCILVKESEMSHRSFPLPTAKWFDIVNEPNTSARVIANQ